MRKYRATAWYYDKNQQKHTYWESKVFTNEQLANDWLKKHPKHVNKGVCSWIRDCIN